MCYTVVQRHLDEYGHTETGLYSGFTNNHVLQKLMGRDSCEKIERAGCDSIWNSNILQWNKMLLRWLSVKSEHRGAEEDSAVCCINTGRTLLMNVTPGSRWWWWWFLHLIGLTAEDSGRYTCECIKTDGTFNLHVNVTIKDDVSQKRLNQKEAQTSAKMTNSIYLIAVAVVISGVILGFIFQVKSLWGLFEVRSIRTVCAWNSQLFGE